MKSLHSMKPGGLTLIRERSHLGPTWGISPENSSSSKRAKMVGGSVIVPRWVMDGSAENSGKDVFFSQTHVNHGDTLPETNSSPLKIGHPKGKLVFQPSIFRCFCC